MSATDRSFAFYGPINLPHTNALRATLCGMVNEGAKSVTIHFASDGGSTHDGIALYSYLTALPLKITMHAVGIVQSIAIPVFLASETRFASENAAFLFHEYSWTHPQATTTTSSTMEEHTLLLANAVEWSKRIIKTRTKLTDGDFERLKLFDHPHLMSASSAADVGLVKSVREPAITAASQPRIAI